jgi:hypothetical protein
MVDLGNVAALASGSMQMGLSGMNFFRIFFEFPHLLNFSAAGDVLRGYISYLEDAPQDARWSRSDLRNKLIEGGFPKNMDVDQHMDKVSSLFRALSFRTRM